LRPIAVRLLLSAYCCTGCCTDIKEGRSRLANGL